MQLRGRWALVTGASSGIGRDLARELAMRGCHVVLVARRVDRLEQLASELRAEHGVQAEVEAIDLAHEQAPAELFARLARRERAIDVLVNNAGFGVHGAFLDQDLERLTRMVRLNAVAVFELCHLFARPMAERGHGHVLNIASVAGLCPVPSYALYAATKAFVVSLSEALAFELGERGVNVTVSLPGATWTEFFEVSGQKRTLYNRVTGMSSEAVARISVRAMERGRHSIVPGWRNAVMMASAKPFTRRTLAWLTWQLNRHRR